MPVIYCRECQRTMMIYANGDTPCVHVAADLERFYEPDPLRAAAALLRERAIQRFNERRAAGIPIGGPDERKRKRRKSDGA